MRTAQAVTISSLILGIALLAGAVEIYRRLGQLGHDWVVAVIFTFGFGVIALFVGIRALLSLRGKAPSRENKLPAGDHSGDATGNLGYYFRDGNTADTHDAGHTTGDGSGH